MTQSSVCGVNDIFMKIYNLQISVINIDIVYWFFSLLYQLKKSHLFLMIVVYLKNFIKSLSNVLIKYENNINKLPIILLHWVMTNFKQSSSSFYRSRFTGMCKYG